MKIVIMNFSGNVGKSTIAAHLLKPRIPDAHVFSVESINSGADSDGIEVEKLRGKKFGSLIDSIMLLDSAIIDVGASNVEEFLKQMQQYAGSHEEFDLFIIPTLKEKKVLHDTVNTITALRQIQIPSKKIKVVFNKLDLDENPFDEFTSLFGLAKTGECSAHEKGTIYQNEVFERIKGIGKSLGDITKDETDWRQKLREAGTDEEKENAARMVAIKRLAVTANKNLDDVYSWLMK
ncbi:plasmid stabilization protein [Comamonadaceae bacterium OH2310_COT-174]|nr:plasmid stabilization protein [Comamonadaceae bacterium OH2310_COT-174]